MQKPQNLNSIFSPPYWPSYRGLDENQRWIYLNWLTNIDKQVDIGYVFLFYYGLERHLFNGDFDSAYDTIIKLRKHHDNNSFSHYSNLALMLSAIIKKRPDKLALFLKNIDINKLSNEASIYLLTKYIFKQSLTSEDLILISKSVGFTNHRYIKGEYNLYIKMLDAILIELYNEPYFNISKYNLSDCPVSSYPIAANLSIPRDQNTVTIPVLNENKNFIEEVYGLLNGAHEYTKKCLREARKKNSKIIQ